MPFTRQQLIEFIEQCAREYHEASSGLENANVSDRGKRAAVGFAEDAKAADAIAEMLKADADLLKSAIELKRIAREVINSWACVAKANRDFDYIGKTHRALDSIVLPSEGH